MLSVDLVSIHVKVDEKITLRANRDGGLEEMEVKGTMFVSVFDAEKAKLQLAITKDDSKNVPFQVKRKGETNAGKIA